MAKKNKAQLPSLSAWKQLEPKQITEIRHELLELAASLTPVRGEHERNLLAEVVAADGVGGIAIARQIESMSGECGLSWTWVAIIAARRGGLAYGRGNDRDLAALLLATKLSNLGQQADRKGGRMNSNGFFGLDNDGDPAAERPGDRYRELAAKWLAIASVESMSSTLDHLTTARWSIVGNRDDKSGLRHLSAAIAASHAVKVAESGKKSVGGAARAVAAAKAEDGVGGGAAGVQWSADGRPVLTVCPSGIAGKDELKAWAVLAQPMPLAGAGVDPSTLEKVLLGEFPWLAEAVTAMVDDLRLRYNAGMHSVIRPTLLIGPPGSGKTRLSQRLAELSGIGHGALSVGGSSDNRAIQGTARGWSSATPSAVIHIIRQTGIANPVILLDELDKTGTSTHNGNVRQTLLSMMEPLSAKSWPDEALQTPCDLSQVSWVATANDLQPLRGPLLTRLRIIECPLPRPEHFEALLMGIERDLAAELGVDMPEMEPEVFEMLKTGFQRGASIRRLKSVVENLVKLAARHPAARPLLH